MKLTIPADKAMHFVAGAATSVAVFTFGLAVWNTPLTAALLGALGACIAGAAKEALDYWDNRKKEAEGLPVAHNVEPLDIVWTAAGGFPLLIAVGLPLLFGA